jgi:hypothetical protein
MANQPLELVDYAPCTIASSRERLAMAARVFAKHGPRDGEAFRGFQDIRKQRIVRCGSVERKLGDSDRFNALRRAGGVNRLGVGPLGLEREAGTHRSAPIPKENLRVELIERIHPPEQPIR